jgi:hypothetical protein
MHCSPLKEQDLHMLLWARLLPKSIESSPSYRHFGNVRFTPDTLAYNPCAAFCHASLSLEAEEI